MAACELLGEMRILRGLNHGEVLHHPSVLSHRLSLNAGGGDAEDWKLCGRADRKSFKGSQTLNKLVLQRQGVGQEGQEESPKYAVLRTEGTYLRSECSERL